MAKAIDLRKRHLFTRTSSTERECEGARGFLVTLVVSLVLALTANSQTNTPKVALHDLPMRQTEILVLGTPHLRELEKWDPSVVRNLNRVLSEWHPTLIVVESMPPADIEREVQVEGADGELVTAFAGSAVKLGKEMQQKLGLDAVSARKRVVEIGQHGVTDAVRPELIGLLLASYDFPSAVLQWAKLSQEARAAATSLPEDVTRKITDTLFAANETYAVAVQVALRSGLERLESVDDHLDDGVLSTMDPKEIMPLMQHPLYKRTVEAPLYTQEKARLAADAARGDLLPYYLYVNSPERQRQDIATQWGFFFKTNLPSGVDRYRYMLWEARNQAIAAKIAALIATRRPERVLVIFGAGHKPFLDADLASSAVIHLTNLRELRK